jgi:hypothetical protein
VLPKCNLIGSAYSWLYSLGRGHKLKLNLLVMGTFLQVLQVQILAPGSIMPGLIGVSLEDPSVLSYLPETECVKNTSTESNPTDDDNGDTSSNLVVPSVHGDIV